MARTSKLGFWELEGSMVRGGTEELPLQGRGKESAEGEQHEREDQKA